MNTLLYRSLLRVRPAPLAGFVKHLLGIKRQVVDTVHGRFWIDPASVSGLELLTNGVYEQSLIDVVRSVKPGGVFIDLGANEGYFSIIASRIAGRVIAIEPQTRLQSTLAENIRLNNANNVEVFQCAISDKNDTSTLYLSSDMNNGSTALSNNTRLGVHTQSVETKTLERLFEDAGIQEADLMKVDIEGFEVEAILGSPSLFREHRIKNVALEMHPDIIRARGLDPLGPKNLLEECGYRLNPKFQNWVFSIMHP